MSNIFTNGCFDILHPAHFNLFMYCRHLAGPHGKVYVGLDSDEKVRKDKGDDRPIFTFEERKEYILSLRDYSQNLFIIDNAFQFNTNEELYNLIKSLEPDIIVKGADWQGNTVGSDLAQAVHFPYNPKVSTSYTISRVREKVKEKLEVNFRNELIGEL